MRDGMAPPDPLHTQWSSSHAQLALAACLFLTSLSLLRRTVLMSSGPSQICIVGPCRWISTLWPARCLPQLTCCQATEITPFMATVREIQSSPSRSPSRQVASAGRAKAEAAKRLAGVAMSRAECGRWVL
jgi:hypothetical protein